MKFEYEPTYSSNSMPGERGVLMDNRSLETLEAVEQLREELSTARAGLEEAQAKITAHTLAPVEKIALTIALAQIKRDDNVAPNTTAVLVWALERITS